MIHLDHQREPDFPGRDMWRATLVFEPGTVFRFKAAKPQIDRGPGHLENAADTQLTPPLLVELDHLETGLRARRMAVIGAQGELPLHRPRALLPELFDGLVINMVVAFIMDDPG